MAVVEGRGKTLFKVDLYLTPHLSDFFSCLASFSGVAPQIITDKQPRAECCGEDNYLKLILTNTTFTTVLQYYTVTPTLSHHSTDFLRALNGRNSGNKTVNQPFKPAQVVLPKFNAYKCRLHAVLTWSLSYFKEFLSVNIQLRLLLNSLFDLHH